jgi:hypothetical protein
MPTKLSTFNASPDTGTSASHYYVEVANDGFIRSKALADVKTEIVTTAVLGSGTANASTYLRGDRTWSTLTRDMRGGGSDLVFLENDQVVTTNYTITAGKNAMTAGPITINAGVTVTVPSGSVWTIV